MQLDNSYARDKFAREATGGISGWKSKIDPPVLAAVINRNERGIRVAVEYPRQDFLTIVGDWQFAWQPSTPATLRDYLVRTTTSSTGAAIISLVNVRKATPIFRESVVSKFETLMAEWKATRNQLNSGTEIFIHPAYQQIIGMGTEVVPLILREMEANIDDWFWALKAITGKDPVPPAHRGRLKLMASDWLGWAMKQGYQW